MTKARRYVIVGVVAVAAIVTPPDPGSQLVLALPLYILFEGSLLLMRIGEKRRARQEAKEAKRDKTDLPAAENVAE